MTTSIEWVHDPVSGRQGVTWNVVTGCDRKSAGCDHCYALRTAARMKAMGQPRYQADGHPATSGPGFAVTLHPDLLDLPRKWSRPRTVFVNSMSDLFHARVPYEFVERVWETMAATPRHTFQVLTKRADRMQRFATRLVERFGVLPNVWLGATIESAEVVKRAEHLIRTPAAIRFVSAEPLLGPLDLSSELIGHADGDLDAWEALTMGVYQHRIHWLIAGGESGPGCRPAELEWFRSLRDQCAEAGTAFFMKQIGTVLAKQWGGTSIKGGDPSVWPADLRVREMPVVTT